MGFYNDYRPGKFADVLGQGQSLQILKAQAKTGNFHHSYLFYGASGSGKTSTARILAMALNCSGMNGTGEPCGECQSCKAIRQGSHWDVVEVDGARFSRVEDARELAYKAQFAPFGGGKKVYIVDECHRLSEAAWDSLLCLVEEPPPHLVLIFCTTEPAKIPTTIKSRCQLYPFHALKPDDVKSKLGAIAGREGIALDPRHLQFIVESAAGNMRSAENILEQVICLN